MRVVMIWYGRKGGVIAPGHVRKEIEEMDYRADWVIRVFYCFLSFFLSFVFCFFSLTTHNPEHTHTIKRNQSTLESSLVKRGPTRLELALLASI